MEKVDIVPKFSQISCMKHANEVFIANISVQKIPSNCFTFSPKCKKKLDEKKKLQRFIVPHMILT